MGCLCERPSHMHCSDCVPIIRRSKAYSPVRRKFHHGQVTISCFIRCCDEVPEQFEIVIRNHAFSANDEDSTRVEEAMLETRLRNVRLNNAPDRISTDKRACVELSRFPRGAPSATRPNFPNADLGPIPSCHESIPGVPPIRSAEPTQDPA